MKSVFALLLITIALTGNLAQAAYTRATSGPVSVTQIYANEYGSPFVWFSSLIMQRVRVAETPYTCMT